ncbi:MAG: RNA polymerase sigma factor [Chlamydiales bacterium]
MKEKELINRSLQGEEKAFEQLVHQNEGKIYRACLSLVRDEEVARDLTQETFLRAHQHLADFRGEARFYTWIWRIAHNLSLNYLRKQKTLEIPLQEERFMLARTQDQEIDEEFMRQIQEGLATLSPKHRIIFEMYDLEQIPQKQIAAMLKIPCGTVRSRLHYARKKMRRFLETHPTQKMPE